MASEGNYENIGELVLRLHVIANSDDYDDQMIKMYIKDSIAEEYSEYFADALNKQESINFINNRSSEITDMVNGILSENGFGYTCEVMLCEDYFPNKYYGEMLFPEGQYTALKIVLGEGEGKNWWCVLYPPLCFLEVGSDEQSLKYAETHGGKIQVRSRIAEWWESVK